MNTFLILCIVELCMFFLNNDLKYFTCETIDTIEQQNPPMKDVKNIISTDVANTVNIHDKLNGKDITRRTFLLPYLIAIPPITPPNNAPLKKV